MYLTKGLAVHMTEELVSLGAMIFFRGDSHWLFRLISRLTSNTGHLSKYLLSVKYLDLAVLQAREHALIVLHERRRSPIYVQKDRNNEKISKKTNWRHNLSDVRLRTKTQTFFN